jgi:trk system potassium uptake protein TrkA
MSRDPTTAPGRETAHEDPTVCVVGSDAVGGAVARRLRAAGNDVRVVGEAIDPSAPPDHPGDPTDVRLLADAGLDDETTVVVATSSDRRNLLIAQLVRAHFDVSRTVVLVNEPTRRDALEAAGHEPVCVSSTLSDAVLETV